MKNSVASSSSDKNSLSKKEIVIARISAIVDELIETEESGIFKEEIDKTEFMEYTSTLIGDGGVSPEMLASFSYEELKERVEGVMRSEVAAGMLNDLSPEQIAAFDEVLKDMRRS